MKKSMSYFVLLLICCYIMLGQSTCKKSRKHLKKEKHANPESSKKSEGFTNSVGNIFDYDLKVTQPPFTVSRCDQIIFYKTTYIADLDDYSRRSQGTLILSAHYVHLLNDNDQLINSMLIGNLGIFPHSPQGAGDCLKFDDLSQSESILICFSSEDTKSEILVAFKKLVDCRGGIASSSISETDRNASTKLSEETFDKILSSCKNKKKAKSQSLASDEYWTPSSHVGVPGS